MAVAKIAISLEPRLLRQLDSLVTRRVFRSRSAGIQEAVEDKLHRLGRTRLADECAKLDPVEEQRFADEGLKKDAAGWPAY